MTVKTCFACCLGLLALLPGLKAAPDVAPSRPNVVIILADDLGYGDLGCYNAQSRIATPALDRLAAAGVRFTDAHSTSAVCTPTRYSLLTGRYNWRSRMKTGVLEGFSPPLIERDRPTIASFLRKQGYQTACLGKWHLGLQWTREDGTLETVDRGPPPRRTGEGIDLRKPVTGGPTELGFDYYFGIAASLDMSPYCWIENDRCLAGDFRPIERSTDIYFTHDAGLIAPGFEFDRVLPTLKARTVSWIADHYQKAAQQPFFLYVPLNAPHLPVAPSAAFRGKSQAGAYGDFVMEVDDYVGSVMETLRLFGALENTLIIFTSDNGGLWHAWDPVETDDVANYQPTPRGQANRAFGQQSNGVLRGTKADSWEGGHRVPFLAHWPQAIKPGVTTVPVEITDLFATIAAAAALPLPADAAPDSFSFLPVLQDPVTGRTDRPFLVHHSIQGVFSVREGDWKYVENRGSGGFSQLNRVKPKAGEATGQLYNIRADVPETKNLFLAEPARVAHFQELLAQVKKSESLRPGALASPTRN